MMRNEQSQQHRLSQGGAGIFAPSQSMQSSTDNVLQSIIKKESQYCDGIKVNHSMLKSITQRLCDVHSLLSPSDDETTKKSASQSPNDKTNVGFHNTINDQKQVLRNIAKENVIREQYVRAFCDTLTNVRNQQQKDLSQPTPPASTKNDVLSFDYQKAILEGIDSLSRKRNIDQEELIQQEKYYRDIADLLGDPKPTTASTKQNKQRRSGGKSGGHSVNDDDDDDEIEMTAPSGGASQIQQLKCPITREYMIDAVENSVCHHVYSRKGIMSYMEQNRRNAKCPVFGCMNQQINAQQLQDHHEIMMLSKREIRRQDMRKEQQQLTSNDVLMDSDEE